MPRTCLACSSTEREAIDKALVAGQPLRNIAKRVSISPAGLLRHKSHVAGAIAKAQEQREEKLGDSVFDEMRRLQRKALELLGKMESEGDYRGAIVAAREARECLESQSALLTRAESRSAPQIIMVNDGVAWAKGNSASEPEGPGVKGQAETETPPNKSNPQDRLLPERAFVSRTLPPRSSATETDSQPRPRRRPVGAVDYLLGRRW